MPRVPTLLSAGMVSLTAALVQPDKADAYQVDCAILLCLAGGWPASAECSRARATFIRRITPWPIEPPLQIWRCPMRASSNAEARPFDRLIDIAFRTESLPLALTHSDIAELQRVRDQADLDISDPAFDFVRSIRVFHIERAQQRWSGGDNDTCNQSQRVQLGSYGKQGDFDWQRSHVGAVPSAFVGLQGWNIFLAHDQTHCPGIHLRSVFVEWRDYEGRYGFEQVNY